MYQLTIKDPNNLLSVIYQRDVDDADVAVIKAALDIFDRIARRGEPMFPRHKGSIIGANAAGPSGSVFAATYPERAR